MIQGQCDVNGTLANFFVQYCGRDKVGVWAGWKGEQTAWIPGFDVTSEPVKADFAIGCAEPLLRLRIPEDATVDARRPSLGREYIVHGQNVFDLFYEWSSGRLSTDEAMVQMRAK